MHEQPPFDTSIWRINDASAIALCVHVQLINSPKTFNFQLGPDVGILQLRGQSLTDTCIYIHTYMHAYIHTYMMITGWWFYITSLKNISQWEGLSHILWKKV